MAAKIEIGPKRNVESDDSYDAWDRTINGRTICFMRHKEPQTGETEILDAWEVCSLKTLHWIKTDV